MSKDLMNPFNDDFDDFDAPMDNFFGNLGRSMFDGMSHMPEMRTNVSDDGKAYHVKAELPGFKKNQIHMDYRNNMLQIHAVHNLNRQTKNDQTHVIRKEISNSNVSRAFHLPNVNFDKITASYDGGVLNVDLPKNKSAQQNDHRINIQ